MYHCRLGTYFAKKFNRCLVISGKNDKILFPQAERRLKTHSRRANQFLDGGHLYWKKSMKKRLGSWSFL
jgi:hypothetical protein